MNISKSSWHYRLLSRLNMLPGLWRERNNTDLCTYMRRLALAFFLLALAAFMVVTYPYGWYLAFHNLLQSPLQQVVRCFCSITNILLGIWATAGLVFCAIRAKEKWGDRQITDEYKPGIFAAYWQQLKDRTCRIVTYSDTP